MVTMHSSDLKLKIADKTFASRLFLGSGKYRSTDEMLAALAASGTEMVTVAIKRLNLSTEKNQPSLMDTIDWELYQILPNTAGCATADEAVLVAKLAREITGSSWVKLEVIKDLTYLLPDPIGTAEAAEKLVKAGFTVLPYINADPALAQKLEDIGCAAVMPLGSPIGSGRGILNLEAIKIIVEQARVPVIVDAGLGVPSEAAQAMEHGVSAVLVNSAIAEAGDPPKMAEAFSAATAAGRQAYLAKRMPEQTFASASSPIAEQISFKK